jgi:hypothetical protein
MRIALCLRGCHYLSKEDYFVDFETSINNYKYFLLDCFKDHQLDIFISTYNSEKLDKLIKIYNPIKYSICKVTNSTYAGPDLCNHHSTLNNLIINHENEYNFKYDIIINTRFDLLFFTKITDMNIDISKFNICFKNTQGGADDNIFIFPRIYLLNFEYCIQQISKNNNYCTHFIHNYLPDDDIYYSYILSNDDIVNKIEYKYFGFNRIRGSINNSNKYIDSIIALNKHLNLNINVDFILNPLKN